MKLVIIICSIILIVASSFTKFGEPEKDILGKWKIDDAYVNSFARASIASTRKTNPEQAEQMEQNIDGVLELISNLSFDYKADSTVDLVSPQGVVPAKWRLTNNNHNMIITRPNGTERKDSVLELSATRYKILQGEGRDTILFVR